MIQNEILSAIDNVDVVSCNTEVCVIESLVDAYQKSFMIMENMENVEYSTFSIFQEGSVLDTVKKEGKKDDNKFITILMFIPRLIRAFIKNLKPPKDAKDTANKIKKFCDDLSGLSTAEKKRKVEQLNKQFNGKYEVYLDEKSGKIKFKKDINHVIEKITIHASMVFATYNLYKRIKKEVDFVNPSSLRTFIDDCDKLIHGDYSMKVSEIMDDGVGALGDLLSDFFAVSGEVTLLGTEITTHLEDIKRKDVIKDVPNEKKQEVIDNITKVVSKITQINAMIASAAGILGSIRKLGDLFADGVRLFENANDVYDEALRRAEANNPMREGETNVEHQQRVIAAITEERKKMKQEQKDEAKRQQEEAKAQHEAEKAARRQKNDNNDSDK